MSKVQTKKKSLDMRISRKTINAIQGTKTSRKNFDYFESGTKKPKVDIPKPIKKKKRTLGLNLPKKNVHIDTTALMDKLESLDKNETEINTNDIPLDFVSLNQVLNNDNIDEINNIKSSTTFDEKSNNAETPEYISIVSTTLDKLPKEQNKRIIKNMRRGHVRSVKVATTPASNNKPFYITVDNDINYNEIMSQPDKKGSEVIDQNSQFFTSPSVFEDEEIKYSEVDLSLNYGSEYLQEDYLAPDNGLDVKFLGAIDDSYLFESETNMPKKVEKDNSDIIDFTSAEKEDENEDRIISDKLVAEILSNGDSDSNLNDLDEITNLIDFNSINDLYAIDNENTDTKEDVVQEKNAADNVISFPTTKPSNASNFSSMIFKTFKYDKSDNNVLYDSSSYLPTPEDIPVPINYVERADSPSIQKEPLIESASINNELPTPVASAQNILENTIQKDEILDISSLNTDTTLIEDDFEEDIDAIVDSNEYEIDNPIDDDDALEFDDSDIEFDDVLDIDVDIDEEPSDDDVENEFDFDNIEEVSIDDIDLTEDNILDYITAAINENQNVINGDEDKNEEVKKAEPLDDDIKQKLTDELSGLDKELQDELLSEMLLDSDDIIDENDIPEDSNDQNANTDIELSKLVNTLSSTISDLENSITLPEIKSKNQEENNQEEIPNKAINILINKDDIFSISIDKDTYDILADFAGISVVSENINIATPKNNFFVKIGNKYIEIHRKEDAKFILYTNFEDIEFENAINNINFAKKRNKIELTIKEAFKLSSVENKVSLSIMNTNLANTTTVPIVDATADVEPTLTDNPNSICDNNVLIINEETQKVYLPYNIEEVMDFIKNPNNEYHTIRDVVDGEFTLPLQLFKMPIISRFKEAYNFMRTKENSSIVAALDLAFELMFNTNLNPAIIRACRNLRELNVYLDCLYENELENFDCFKIVYKVLPKIQ